MEPGAHTMKASRLQPRKAPAQDRSKAMVELILQAATRVLERESLAGFNTNRVAEVAGISIGSLYQYFPNKAALITMLIARTQTALADQLREVHAEIVSDRAQLDPERILEADTGLVPTDHQRALRHL